MVDVPAVSYDLVKVKKQHIETTENEYRNQFISVKANQWHDWKTTEEVRTALIATGRFNNKARSYLCSVEGGYRCKWKGCLYCESIKAFKLQVKYEFPKEAYTVLLTARNTDSIDYELDYMREFRRYAREFRAVRGKPIFWKMETTVGKQNSNTWNFHYHILASESECAALAKLWMDFCDMYSRPYNPELLAVNRVESKEYFTKYITKNILIGGGLEKLVEYLEKSHRKRFIEFWGRKAFIKQGTESADNICQTTEMNPISLPGRKRKKA